MNYFCARYKRVTCFSRDATNPTKDTREITDHHVLHMFRKCRMLNLRFLRDSYVTWERRRLQTIKFQALGRLLGTLGWHFGTIFGIFSGHFGGPERTWKHIAYKRGGGFSHSRFWNRKMTKNEDFWSPKSSKIEAKWHQKRKGKNH